MPLLQRKSLRLKALVNKGLMKIVSFLAFNFSLSFRLFLRTFRIKMRFTFHWIWLFLLISFEETFTTVGYSNIEKCSFKFKMYNYESHREKDTCISCSQWANEYFMIVVQNRKERAVWWRRRRWWRRGWLWW